MSAADRLNEIEARANAATEGPWTPDEYTEVDPDGFYELARVIAPDPDGDDWCAIGVVHTGILRPDAEFIAHARTDVPWLIEQVRKRDAALRAVLELIDSRGKQAAEALPPSLAALVVPSYQFNVRASDVIRTIKEAFS